MTLNISIISENGGIATMKQLWKVIAIIIAKAEELAEAWADDEMAPPEWADPIKWKESLL